MSDSTVHAEALIATVARAFYDDDAVCLVDVLLRDKFLRDDDMGPRLSLPAKQLRRTLQFLQEEHLVKFELVDDLSSGGSQATKFWYIDYNHAVHSIRYRIYKLQKSLEESEMRARSSSFYLCPNYFMKICNGRYTETEAQRVVDLATGLFLCQECAQANEANPDPPAKSSYTLQLVDNTRDLKLAMDNLRRVNVQMSCKRMGNQQLRAGVYDLLQKVRATGKGPLTSNMPSENRSQGIGSTRLKGTGRTAGIKAKKLAAQRGNATPPASTGGNPLGGASRNDEGNAWAYFKNASGQEVVFTVDKGGGARANILATRGRRWMKLLDSAASRVSTQVPVYLATAKRKQEPTADNVKKQQATEFDFLQNNIGRNFHDDEEDETEEETLHEITDEEESGDDVEDAIVAPDKVDELLSMTEEERRIHFQKQYKLEKARQEAIMSCQEPGLISDDNGEEEDIDWVEG